MPQVEFASTHEELYSFLLDRFRDDYGFANATQIGNEFATTISTDREGVQLLFFDWHSENQFKHHPHLCLIQLPVSSKKFYLRRLTLPNNSAKLMQSEEALSGLYNLLRCHYIELDRIRETTWAAQHFEGGTYKEQMQTFFNSQESPSWISLKQLVKPHKNIKVSLEPAGKNIKLAGYSWINPELYLAERRIIGASELTADVVSQFGREPDWLGAMYSYANFIFKRFEGRFHSLILHSPAYNAVLDIPWATEWLELDYSGREQFRHNLLSFVQNLIEDLLEYS